MSASDLRAFRRRTGVSRSSARWRSAVAWRAVSSGSRCAGPSRRGWCKVDKLAQAQAVAPAVADYQPTDPQIAWHLARFIEEVRSIPADPVVLRHDWLDAYNYVTDKGALALNDYARPTIPSRRSGRCKCRSRWRA
jgi:type IV secretion system protein VirB5